MISLSCHETKSITAKSTSGESVCWLDLDITDHKGKSLNVTVFLPVEEHPKAAVVAQAINANFANGEPI